MQQQNYLSLGTKPKLLTKLLQFSGNPKKYGIFPEKIGNGIENLVRTGLTVVSQFQTDQHNPKKFLKHL